MDDAIVEAAAKAMHDEYEARAHEFNYTTRPDTAKPWSDVPENNKALMRVAVRAALNAAGAAVEPRCASCGCPKRYHDTTNTEYIEPACYGAQNGWPCTGTSIHEFAAGAAVERDGVEERIESGDLPSTTSVNGRRLTWRELVEHHRDEATEAQAWRRVLSDLSRCEHGRHAGDACSGCGGVSVGNRFLPPGTRIGTSLYGTFPIVVPARAQFAKIEEWSAE